MLNNVAELIVWTKLFATNPVALAHEEWEVLNFLVALEFEALKKLFCAEVEFFVELAIETIPVCFFAFAEADTVLDTDADKVDRSEGTVTAASDVTISFLEAGTKDACAAAHGCDFGIWITWLVVLEVEWSINKGEVREEALCGDFHRALEEVIVWIAWVVVDAFLYLENGDWEDWRFVVAKTVHGCFEEHLGNETTFWACISTEVDGSEWNLSTGTAVHGVEVVNKAFHCLECLMLGVFVRVFNNDIWHFGFFELFVVAKSDIVFNFNL